MIQEEYQPRKVPNILITGTPGTGKSTFSQLLNQSLNFQYVPIAQIITEHKLYDEWNQQFNVPQFDQEKLVGFISTNYDIPKGGLLFDFQNPEVFPQQYFDLIILMRCENQTLYKRLEERNYKPQKITENIECEIFEEIKYNIEDHFLGKIPVLQLRNEKKEEMEPNLQKAVNFLLEYKNKREQESK